MFNQIQIMKKTYSTLINKVALKHNLSECEIVILLFLNKNRNQDMAKDIVKYLMISKAHVSGLVSNLEMQGYITKTVDTEDKKKMHLEITEKAKPIIKEVRKEAKQMKRLVFDGITKEEVEVTKVVLNKIKINLKNNYKIDLN